MRVLSNSYDPKRCVINWVERVSWVLVYVSIVMYVVELSLGGRDSRESPAIFLWTERIVAAIFTIEYAIRLWDSRRCVREYALGPLGAIDLMAILPFWLGFFVPVQYLGVIRTLRILRFAKFVRYSRSLQLVLLGFYRAWPSLRSLVMVFLAVGLFNTVLIYELERYAQPDAFGSLSNCAWYVLVSATTVGYGDMSPATWAGKLCASITLLAPALMLYASIVGVVGTEFVKVVEEEIDPTIDPLDEFNRTREKRRSVRAAA